MWYNLNAIMTIYNKARVAIYNKYDNKISFSVIGNSPGNQCVKQKHSAELFTYKVKKIFKEQQIYNICIVSICLSCKYCLMTFLINSY